jgi:hypothetical protein
MSLQAHFDSLTDAELRARIESGGLTEEAMTVALAEAASRGVIVEGPAPEADGDDLPSDGDMVLLERGLAPQEAQVLSGLPMSVRIPADAGDTNMVQADALLSIALGGASLRVPASRLQEAQESLVAFRRGDFALGDDFESGDTAA